MNAKNVALNEIAAVVGSVRKKGVKLWAVDGELRYKAPRGALTAEELERLRASKSQIAFLLERAQKAHGLGPRSLQDRAPATFPQLVHWQLHGLSSRPSVKQLAAAVHLFGRINVGLLQRSLDFIVDRHEALRTRIAVIDQIPEQRIDAADECRLIVDDLSENLPSDPEEQVRRIIDDCILEPVDFSKDQLFCLRWVKLRDTESVLILAMEHMISDAFSLNIFLRDLFSTYRQLCAGRRICLPTIPVQFADYAEWQWASHPDWLEKNADYWAERLRGFGRIRFTDPLFSPTDARLGWGTAPVVLDQELESRLRDWCRANRTTLVMSVFTAYIALLFRWYAIDETIVRYQTDGRTHPKVQNTIGFFASCLHLRVHTAPTDSLVDLLKKVTEEYCRASERSDFSYVEAQQPAPEFTRNGRFNWVPHGLLTDPALSDDLPGISCRPFPFTNPVLQRFEIDSEPTVLLYEHANEIVGGVHYSLKHFSKATMARFASGFMCLVRALLQEPHKPIRDIVLP